MQRLSLLRIASRIASRTVVAPMGDHISLTNAVRVAAIFVAGRKEDLIQKNPELESEINELVEKDPSKKGKFLEWSVKQLKAGAKIEDLIPTLEFFHQNQSRFLIKDIDGYKSLKDLEDQVKEISSKSSKRQDKKEVKASGSKKIWESDKLVLIRVDNKRACIEYGRGTKWCITMSDASYYEQYSSKNTAFYFLIRKEPVGDDFDKVAFAWMRRPDNRLEGFEVYDAADNRIDAPDVPDLTPEIMSKMETDAAVAPKSYEAKVKVGEIPIEEAMANPDADVRKSIVQFVDQDRLQDMVKDPDEGVRYQIVRRTEKLKVLEFLTHDKSEDVAAAARDKLEEAIMLNEQNAAGGFELQFT